MKSITQNILIKLVFVPLFLAVATAAPVHAQNYDTLQGMNFGGDSGGDGGGDGGGGDAGALEDDAVAEDSAELSVYGEVAEVYKEQSTISMTQERVGVFNQKLRRFLGESRNYFDDVAETLGESSPTGSWTYFLGVLIFVAFLLAIGRAGAMLYGIFVALPIMRRIQKPNPKDLSDKLPVLAARVGLQIGGMAISLAIVIAVGAGFYQDHEPTIKTVVAIIGAYVMVQLIDVCWRMAISPFLPDYRIPEFSDADAVRLYSWVGAAALFGVSSTVYYSWLREIGAPEEVVGNSIIVLTFMQVVIILAMIRYNGRALTQAILGGLPRNRAPWPAAMASVLWRPLVVAYLGFAFLEMSFRVIMGLELGVPLLGGALAVLLAVLIVYAVTVYIVERLFQRIRRMRELNAEPVISDPDADEAANKLAIRDVLEDVGDEEGGAGPAAMRPDIAQAGRRGMRTFEDLARRVASLFAIGAGAYLMIRIWVGAAAFADNTTFDLTQDLIDISLMGYIAFHAARIWMDQKIESETGPEIETEPGDEGGAAVAASRLGTLLPLFRSFVLIVIAVTAVMLVLMKMGINVAPLFAGAGVVGLAIGFGAQSLVKDILSGVFFLTDDAFRKGEYIDIGDVKGTVEKISLRSFQLRHHLGALNTVPFGEIKHITNYSRDWVMMKLPLRLTYDTDVDTVRKLVKKLGQKLLEHPTEGPKFVQPLKSQGVYMMEDSAMIFRVKFMTRPGDQWTTRKLVYTELRKLFAENGVKFAHKEVTVRIPEIDGKKPADLTPEEQKAVGAAARRAVEEDTPAPAMADDR